MLGINTYIRKRVENFLGKADVEVGGKDPWDITVTDDSVFTDTILKGTLGLGDGYSSGKWDAKELDLFFERVMQVKRPRFKAGTTWLQEIRSKLLNTQTGRRAFQVGEEHYDLGNDMYELMLGDSMAYSAAMFNEGDDLTQAQFNKFDALCQKLELEPGMKILEIGCGWGSFAKHAAENYDVSVTGLTVSKEQKTFAEKLCEGLDVEFILRDYQTLDESFDAAYDRVVSIEMIEAVGRKNFGTYFETIERVLKPDGLAGIQAIVGTGGSDPFLSTRIFPNGLVPSEKDIIKNSQKKRLRMKHWHSFGTDYDKTLMEWDKSFRKNWNKIKKLKDEKGQQLYDDNFYRMWRFYLMLCAASFRVGINDDAQIIFSKPNTLSPLK